MPFPFICFDTEDDSKELLESGQSGFNKRVTQIAASTAEGKRYYSPGDVDGFKQWLLRQKEPYIYANNIGYDLGNLFGKKLDQLDTTLIGSRVISARWRGKVFLDVFNIWFCSVKQLGLAFDLEKLQTESMATDRDYVFRDVEIIRKAMLFAWEFATQIGLKRLPNTAGGICFATWKHLGGENCHDSNELSREAYYGGRVELFKVKSETGFVCYTDVNSLYPSALLKDYPGPLEDCGKELADYGIARVDIDLPQQELPALPYRDPKGRICYPCGKFTGTWTIAEIKQAIKDGGKVLKVHKCLGTSETSKPYKDVMERFYAGRLQAGNAAEKEFFKRMMNAFYGRLGTTGVIGRTVFATEQNIKEGVLFGDRVLVNYSMPLAEETNWCHAAYVTAYGRLALLGYLRKVGAQNLIYCDTDSCIFDVPHPRLNMQFAQQPVIHASPRWGDNGNLLCSRLSIPFPTGKDLGVMKLEGWDSFAQCWAPKMYRYGAKYKAKGVPQRLAKSFIESGMAHYDIPYKYREAVAFYDRGNARHLSVWRTVEKRIRSGYDKKILKGNHFSPCNINSLLSS